MSTRRRVGKSRVAGLLAIRPTHAHLSKAVTTAASPSMQLGRSCAAGFVVWGEKRAEDSPVNCVADLEQDDAAGGRGLGAGKTQALVAPGPAQKRLHQGPAGSATRGP